MQQIVELPGVELHEALTSVSTHVAEVLGCEKVDTFLLDEAHQTLLAVGTSETPLGERQRALGLHNLALANGGRIVQVFESGTSYLEHHADLDPEELAGIVENLAVKSTVSVPLEVNGVRRGVLTAASSLPEFFQARDLNFLTITSRWIGMLCHRAEFAEHSRKIETEQARRKGADEVITVLAHDLRNHLQPLIGRLQMMRLNVENGIPVVLSNIAAALASAQRLARLTEDLLDMKRLDEGLLSLRLAPADLAVLCRETAESLGTGTVPVHATGEPSLVAVVDEERIRQTLENLVANAIKYSPPGKPVQLHVVGGAQPSDTERGHRGPRLGSGNFARGCRDAVRPLLFQFGFERSRAGSVPGAPDCPRSLGRAQRSQPTHWRHSLQARTTARSAGRQ